MSGDGNRGRYMMRGNLWGEFLDVADVVTDVFGKAERRDRTGNSEDE